MANYKTVKTTYYLVTVSGTVVRATTKRAQEKIRRIVELHPGAIRPLPPKEARELIAAKREYWKIQDLM